MAAHWHLGPETHGEVGLEAVPAAAVCSLSYGGPTLPASRGHHTHSRMQSQPETQLLPALSAGLMSPPRSSKPVALPATWTPPTGHHRCCPPTNPWRGLSVSPTQTCLPARVSYHRLAPLTTSHRGCPAPRAWNRHLLLSKSLRKPLGLQIVPAWALAAPLAACCQPGPRIHPLLGHYCPLP